MVRISLTALALTLVVASLAWAGATTGDITVESDAGVITVLGDGADVTVDSGVHSVDVREGAQTGDITVYGTVDEVTTIGIGHNVNVNSNVGSVKIGGN